MILLRDRLDSGCGTARKRETCARGSRATRGLSGSLRVFLTPRSMAAIEIRESRDRHSGASRQRVGQNRREDASGRRAKFPTIGFGESMAAMKGGSAPENTILKVKAKLGQA
jgi:hypothetical protein